MSKEKKKKGTPISEQKNADWSIWERILDTKLKNFQGSFLAIINPDIIDAQNSALTNTIIDSATDFFGNTETSKKN